jgi:hypothetical protein
MYRIIHTATKALYAIRNDLAQAQAETDELNAGLPAPDFHIETTV